MTLRQTEILTFICEEVDGRGRPPTLAEIGARFRMTAPSAADHLRAIEAKGFIERSCHHRRSIRVIARPEMRRDNALPMLGRIAAGKPLLDSMHVIERVPIPPGLFSPPASFLMKVQGDSMTDEGIHSGDLIAIRAQDTAVNGQIVAAGVLNRATGDLELTLKRLNLGIDVRLESCNVAKNYPSLKFSAAPDENEAAVRIVGIYCGHLHFGRGGFT